MWDPTVDCKYDKFQKFMDDKLVLLLIRQILSITYFGYRIRPCY